jgi:hypothetical protein
VLERRAEPDDGLFELVTVASRREWIERVVGDLALNPFRPEALGLPRAEHRAASRFGLSLYRPGREGVPRRSTARSGWRRIATRSRSLRAP